MPVRSLEVILSLLDRISQPLDLILKKIAQVDGREVVATAEISADAGGADELTSALEGVDSAGQKTEKTLDKTTEALKKEGKEADDAGKKTEDLGQKTKVTDSIFSRLHATLDTASTKLQGLKSALQPIKQELQVLSAVIVGFGTYAVYSAAKVEGMIDELDRLHGKDFSKDIQNWAEQPGIPGRKSEKLAIALDLSDLKMDSPDIKKFGTEIEKFYHTKFSSMKRLGVSSAEDLAQQIAKAAKGGRTEELRRVLTSGAITDTKMNAEMERLRANYEKFAFASEDVVKQQALLNLTMKELHKTNMAYDANSQTLAEKIENLQNKFAGLTEGIGNKLEPIFKAGVDAISGFIDMVEAVPGHDEILIFLGTLVVALGLLVSAVMMLAPPLIVAASLMGSLAAAGGVAGVIASITAAIGVLITALGGAAVAAGAALLPFAVVAVVAAGLYLLYTRTTVLQDSWAKLTSIGSRVVAIFQKVFSTLGGALKGNKADLQTIGDWVRNFLDGLIPGWLSDIFAAAGGYFRKAMEWFDQIMKWWNHFLKTLGKVYDAIKGILGIGTPGTPEAKPKSPEQKAVEAAGLSEWNSGLGSYGRDAGIPTVNADFFHLQNFSIRNKTSGPGKIEADIMAKYGLKPGEAVRVGDKLGQRQKDGSYNSVELSPKDMKNLTAAEDKLVKEEQNIANHYKYTVKTSVIKQIDEKIGKDLDNLITDNQSQEGPIAAQNVNADGLPDPLKKGYQEGIHQTDVKLKSGPDGAMQVGPFDLMYNMAKGAIWGNDSQKKPQAAIGATINEGGQIEVHDKEEVIPAKITSGVGKLGSLLSDALAWRDGERAPQVAPGGNTPQAASEQAPGEQPPLTVNLAVENHFHVNNAVDLKNLDVTKLIDWNRAGYEIEKIQKRFRAQQG